MWNGKKTKKNKEKEAQQTTNNPQSNLKKRQKIYFSVSHNSIYLWMSKNVFSIIFGKLKSATCFVFQGFLSCCFLRSFFFHGWKRFAFLFFLGSGAQLSTHNNTTLIPTIIPYQHQSQHQHSISSFPKQNQQQRRKRVIPLTLLTMETI